MHRDLAARNVLLAGHTCKIADFGLSREVLTAEKDYYTATGGARIPIRWTAYESLFFRKFSSSSDVWAFAVVLHEIFADGGHPYAKHSNREVVRLVDEGFRLPPQHGCPRGIYALMIACWHPDPSLRPTFPHLVHDLTSMDVGGFEQCGLQEDKMSSVYAKEGAVNPLLLSRDECESYLGVHKPCSEAEVAASVYAYGIPDTGCHPSEVLYPNISRKDACKILAESSLDGMPCHLIRTKSGDGSYAISVLLESGAQEHHMLTQTATGWLLNGHAVPLPASAPVLEVVAYLEEPREDLQWATPLGALVSPSSEI